MKTALLLFVALSACSCSSTLRYRQRIVDKAGKPIPGAVFFIEVVRPGDPPKLLSFQLAVADADGYAPPRSEPRLEETVGLTSCEAWGYFAAGYPPYILMMRAPCPRPEGGTFDGTQTLTTKPTQFDVRSVMWPQRGDPRREQLRAPGAAPVRAALRAAGIDVSDLPSP